MGHVTKIIGIFFLVVVTVVSCQPNSKSLHMKSFETVWRTVYERHYDPTFGGMNWHEVHDRYHPKIAAVQNDSEFYTLVNRMLFELALSHLLVASHGDLTRYLPTLFAEGGIGIDVRLIDGSAVITSVQPGTPGARAGLHPGFVITRIDGLGVEQIIAEAAKRLIPPFNSRNRRNNITLGILGCIYGTPGTTVSICYRDKQGKTHEKVIMRQSRGRGAVISDALPPFFIEFEARRLDDNIGYIRCNHIADPVGKEFIAALHAMSDTRGLIIDFRGNSGGYFSIVDIIAGHLLAEETLFYTFEFRNRTTRHVLKPVVHVYTKPVVVLIDVLTMSCSEHFAACIQALGRAVIVGERSPGYLLVAQWMRLPNGMAFMHTTAKPVTSDGMIIEGKGVTPDVEIAQDRYALMQGRDVQLEGAINIIKNGKVQTSHTGK